MVPILLLMLLLTYFFKAYVSRDPVTPNQMENYTEQIRNISLCSVLVGFLIF